MLRIDQPSAKTIRQFLAEQEQNGLSYPETGFTKTEKTVKGYDNDHNRALIGKGDMAWQAARAAIQDWKMFPGGWARIAPGNVPIREGETLAMLVHLFGLYWVNPCRIVYTFDEDGPVRRFGFAYGTLPGHIEKGEERFSVEQIADGTVWYDLKAFSKPSLWVVKWGYPVARHFQRRFVLESQESMRQAIKNHP